MLDAQTGEGDEPAAHRVAFVLDLDTIISEYSAMILSNHSAYAILDRGRHYDSIEND